MVARKSKHGRTASHTGTAPAAPAPPSPPPTAPPPAASPPAPPVAGPPPAPGSLEAPPPGEANPDASWQHSKYPLVYLRAEDVQRPIRAYYLGFGAKIVKTRSGEKSLAAATLTAYTSDRRTVKLEVLLNDTSHLPAANSWCVIRSNGRGLEVVA